MAWVNPREREQHDADTQTIRDHLIRGTQPETGRREWGNLEWALARVFGFISLRDLPWAWTEEET